MLLSTSQQDFPVTLGQQVLGLLGRNALLRGMASNGPDAYVAGVMDREFPRVKPEMPLNDALPMLSQASCVLVMDEEDQLLGLLTRENVSEFLMLRKFGMPAEAPTAS
jgi:stage IV sporulation protein FB